MSNEMNINKSYHQQPRKAKSGFAPFSYNVKLTSCDLPRYKLPGANAKAYCIPFVQVFKLFQYHLHELVLILFRH